jgi:hypothetical protein
MKTETKSQASELLIALLKADIVKMNANGDFVGKASDGYEVVLGNIDTIEQTVAYLADHPTPSDW